MTVMMICELVFMRVVFTVAVVDMKMRMNVLVFVGVYYITMTVLMGVNVYVLVGVL